MSPASGDSKGKGTFFVLFFAQLSNDMSSNGAAAAWELMTKWISDTSGMMV